MKSDPGTINANVEESQFVYQKINEIVKNEVDLVKHISKHEKIYGEGCAHKVAHKGSRSDCLHIYPDNTFHCFSCQAHGTAIDYEMSRIGASYVECMLSLQEQYKFDLPPDACNLTQEQIDKLCSEYARGKRLAEVRKAFLLETKRHLYLSENEEILDYILSRKLTHESIDKYGLGYCPAILQMKQYDFTNEELHESGLFFANGKPSLAGRITFPYFTSEKNREQNRPSYFHGRVTNRSIGKMKDGERLDPAKYIFQTRNSEKGAIPQESIKCLWQWNVDAKTLGTEQPYPILVTEGVFDAMLAAQELQGYTILSAGTTKLTETVQVPMIAQEMAKNPFRKVTILFDNDENKAGNDAAKSLPGKIVKHYRAVHPPEEELQKELDEGRPDPLYGRIRIATLRIPPNGSGKADLADYIEKGRKSELLKWIQNAETYFEHIATLDGRAGRYNPPEKKPFDPVRPAIYLQQQGMYPLMIDDELHSYDYDDGLYKPTNDKIRQPITELLYPGYISGRVTSVVDYITDSFRIMPEEYVYDAENDKDDILLKVNNGWIMYEPKFKGWAHVPNNPYLVSKTAVSMDFDRDAECPKLDAFIQETWTHSDPEDFYKICALAMSNYRGYKKAILFVGPQGCGKSTMIKIVESLIHRSGTSAVGLADMVYAPFGKAGLIGSKLNTVYDVSSTKINDVSALNSIIDGETIEINAKHKPQVNYKVQALQLWGCNTLPIMKDYDMSFINRLKIFYFDNQVRGTDKEVKEIEKRFIEDPTEMSGLLNKCLPYLADIKNLQLHTSIKAEDIMLSQTMLTSPVARFSELYLTADKDSYVGKDVLFNSFNQYESTFIKASEIPTAKGKFKERLMNLHKTILRSQTRKPIEPGGSPKPVFYDIKFKQDLFEYDLQLFETEKVEMGRGLHSDRSTAADLMDEGLSF